MKRSVTLLLAALLSVALLTACGRDDKREDTLDNAVTDGMEDLKDDVEDGVHDAGDAIADGTEDVKDALTDGRDNTQDALTDSDTANRSETQNGTADTRQTQEDEALFKGASYEQMLRNAQVHDTDGDLNDNENAVTPGIAH